MFVPTVLIERRDQVFEISDQVPLFRFVALARLPWSVRGQICVDFERIIILSAFFLPDFA